LDDEEKEKEILLVDTHTIPYFINRETKQQKQKQKKRRAKNCKKEKENQNVNIP